MPLQSHFLRKYRYFLRIFHFFRIKYTEGMKCINHVILFGIGYEAWLTCDNEDASKKICGNGDFSTWLWALHRWPVAQIPLCEWKWVFTDWCMCVLSSKSICWESATCDIDTFLAVFWQTQVNCGQNLIAEFSPLLQSLLSFQGL